MEEKAILRNGSFLSLFSDENGLLKFFLGNGERYLTIKELEVLKTAVDTTITFRKLNFVTQEQIDEANGQLKKEHLEQTINDYEKRTGKKYPQKRNRPTNIYLIKNKVTGNLKIGSSKNPKSRLNQLNIASDQPLELLGYCEGFENDEKDLQEKYKHLNLNTEWFKYSDEILKEFQIL